jgi:hypothetical protein
MYRLPAVSNSEFSEPTNMMLSPFCACPYLAAKPKKCCVTRSNQTPKVRNIISWLRQVRSRALLSVAVNREDYFRDEFGFALSGRRRVFRRALLASCKPARNSSDVREGLTSSKGKHS